MDGLAVGIEVVDKVDEVVRQVRAPEDLVDVPAAERTEVGQRLQALEHYLVVVIMVRDNMLSGIDEKGAGVR